MVSFSLERSATSSVKSTARFEGGAVPAAGYQQKGETQRRGLLTSSHAVGPSEVRLSASSCNKLTYSFAVQVLFSCFHRPHLLSFPSNIYS